MFQDGLMLPGSASLFMAPVTDPEVLDRFVLHTVLLLTTRSIECLMKKIKTNHLVPVFLS